MVEWKAIYNDGTEYNQYENGKANSYAEIDRSRLSQFVLHENNKPLIVIHLDKRKKLIYRRRVAKHVFGGKEEVVYIVGWQEHINCMNIQSISFLFEDGHIEVLDRFKENHDWFYPVNFIPEEKLEGM